MGGECRHMGSSKLENSTFNVLDVKLGISSRNDKIPLAVILSEKDVSMKQITCLTHIIGCGCERKLGNFTFN